MGNAVPAVKGEERQVEYQGFGTNEMIKLNISMVRSFLSAKTKSGAEASDADIVKFMMLCKTRQLNPWEGDAFLVGYDTQDKGPKFSLITAHQAFLKRAEAHPEYDGMESGVIVKSDSNIQYLEGDFFEEGQALLGGWAIVYFKNRSHPMKKRLKLSTFQKNTQIWKDNPNGMIVKCAEADALRSSFPSSLAGMYLREEVDTIEADHRVIPSEPPLGRAKLTNGNRQPAALPAQDEALSSPEPQKPRRTRAKAEPVPAEDESQERPDDEPEAAATATEGTNRELW